MRGFHQNEGKSGSALHLQGKSRHQRRGLGGRHLLRLLVLLAAQQGFSLVDGKSLSRSILQPAAVVVGTLLAPQPAQAQAVAAPVLTGVTDNNGGFNLTWTHAGTSAGDLISGASNFSHWEVFHRLKGATSWTNEGGPSTSGGISRRSVNGFGFYLDGMVVQVRVRARDRVTSSGVLYGPWSNTHEITVKDTDDDYEPLDFSSSSVTVGAGATSTYTVAMDDDYTYGAGVVSVSSSDTNKVTVSPATLTFTTSTYATAQTVTVTGVASGGSPQINHSFRLTGATADAIPDAGSVGVTVNAAVPTVTPGKNILLTTDQTNNRITEGNTGRKDVTITATLGEAAPIGGMRILMGQNLAANPTGSISNSCSTLSPMNVDACWHPDYGIIAIAAGNRSGTATLRIIGDTTDEVDKTLKLRGSAYPPTGPFSTRLTGWSSSTLTFTIVDDDGAGVTISPETLEVAEGGSGAYTVKLNTEPASSVTVTPSESSDAVSLSPTSLTFTTSNYSQAQTVTVTGEDDANTVDETVTVSHSVSGYSGVTSADVADVTVTTNDDDTPVVTPTTAPAKPTGFRATGGNAQATLVWDDPNDGTITHWAYQRKAGSGNFGGWFNMGGSSATTTSHRITGLTNGTTYAFKIRAVNSIGPGAVSDEARAYPNTKTITLTADSTTITEGDSGRKEVTITATLSEAQAGGLSGLNLTVDSSSTATAGKLTAVSTCDNTESGNEEADYCWPSGPAIDVSAGQLQRTKKIAILSDTRDENDETIIITLSKTGWGGSEITLTIKDDDAPTVPSAPTGLSAAAEDRQVTLSWTNPNDATITGYKVRYGKKNARSSADWGLITGSSASTTSHTVTGLDNNAEYSFKVRAVSIAGDGTATAWVDATPTPAAAPVLTGATSTTSGRINLTWTHAGGSAGALAQGATTFHYWQGAHRLKGATDWTVNGDASPGRGIARRTRPLNLGSTYPDGAVVEVRMRALGNKPDPNSVATIEVTGPWSNTREVTYKNDNLAALTFTGNPLTVTAGSSSTYTVKLSKAYGGVLSVTSGATGKATVDPSSLTFTTGNYNTAQTVTVTGVEAGQATINHAFRLTGASADAIPDAGTVSVTVGAAPPAKPTNFTATAGNGQVTLNWSDPDDATITRWEYQQKTGGNFGDTWTPVPSSGASTTSYTVGSLTNNTAYTFRIRAVSAAGDGAVSDEQSATPVAATPAGVTVSTATLTVNEGSSGTYTMRLNTEPSNTVTITVGGASGDVTVSGSPLTFTTSNYAEPQTVTVNAGEDNDTTNDSATLTHTAASSDTSYGSSLTIASVRVTVTDNDTPGVTVEPTALSVNEGSSGAYTVKLNTEPTHNVTVTVGGASGEVSVTGSPLTFTTSNYGTAQRVTVNAGEDEDTANDSATLTHRAASRDSNYGGSLTIESVSVTVTDNDSPAEEEEELPPAPAQATGLTAQADNAQVTLSWNNPDNATITKWQVQQKQADGSYGAWVDIPSSTATTTSHTVTELTNGTAYSFRIRAVNAGGNSPASAEVRATPLAPPLKPTGLTAQAGHAQVTLSWNNPNNATISKWQYQQKQGDGSYGPWMDIPDSTATTTSHTVTGLTNGMVYSFRIRAVNAGGNGAPSDEVTATPVDQDVVQADKARSQALAATSRTLLGMATDVLGSRTGGEAPVALAGSGNTLGEQAMGIVENLLGIGGSELPTSLTLEDVEDRLWSQSFQLTPPASGMGQEWNPLSPQQRSWALWGAGELRSYRGNDDTEHLSYSGNMKTAWLGVDHQFTDRWMAGAALSFAIGQSDYSYQKTDGSKDGGKMESRLTTFYPYGSFQASEGLRLWGMAGMGWGTQHHQQTGEDTTAEGDLRLQMGVIGFERSLSSIGELSLSLAGDAGLVKSTTDWKAGSGLDDLSVSLHRLRLGIDSSFPLAEHTTAYLNLKGRLDGGDLEMNAAEIVAGLHYSKERFSGFLQGRQTYAFDGSYAESALTAQLRLTANSDGTGLAWTLQPSYGTSDGDVALAAGPSLWTDEQLEALTGSNPSQSAEMALSSRVGYGIHLQSGELLLTPFTEVRISEAGSQHIGLGLALEGTSWNVELSSSTENATNASPTGKVQLNFSKQL